MPSIQSTEREVGGQEQGCQGCPSTRHLPCVPFLLPEHSGLWPTKAQLRAAERSPWPGEGGPRAWVPDPAPPWLSFETQVESLALPGPQFLVPEEPFPLSTDARVQRPP